MDSHSTEKFSVSVYAIYSIPYPAGYGGSEMQRKLNLLTVAASARFVGCSEGAIRANARGGKLPCTKIGQERFFRRSDLEKFKRARTNGDRSLGS